MADVTVTEDRPDPTPDPEIANGDPTPDEPVAPPATPDVVDVETVRDGLASLGSVLHMWRGHPDIDDHWDFTATELDALGPPVASIINRHAATRRMAEHSPEAAVAVTLVRFSRRNIRLSRQIEEWAAAQAAEADPDGVSVDLSPLDES